MGCERTLIAYSIFPSDTRFAGLNLLEIGMQFGLDLKHAVQ